MNRPKTTQIVRVDSTHHRGKMGRVQIRRTERRSVLVRLQKNICSLAVSSYVAKCEKVLALARPLLYFPYDNERCDEGRKKNLHRIEGQSIEKGDIEENIMPLSSAVGPRIVIVDADSEGYEDELHDSELETKRLEFFPNARAVLRSPRRQPPEFCVVNMQLPDMSGLDLYQMLVDRWPGVPIYLVGDHYNPEDEIRARCSGATLYFCKPLEPGWLTAATELVA